MTTEFMVILKAGHVNCDSSLAMAGSICSCSFVLV